MNILIAPDSFKGALSAPKVADAIEQGVLKVFPNANIQKLPLADGGEGTLEILIKAMQGKVKRTEVLDALMRRQEASIGIVTYQEQSTAIIEMAQCAGLAQLSTEERNPSITSTYGVGKLIKIALELGCTQILIAIGGSATNDAGMGMLQALGVVFKNDKGEEIRQGIAGGDLNEVAYIDAIALDSMLEHIHFILASDVSNPLTGEHGASLIYSFQKGADLQMAQQLERNLLHLSQVVEKIYPQKAHFAQSAGAGAAGGMGYALMAFLKAKQVAGAELVMDLYQLDEKLAKISAQNIPSLIITGEGRIDFQTRYGKALFRLAQRAKKYQVPLIALCGSIGEGIDDFAQHGFSGIFSIQQQVQSLEDAMAQTDLLLTRQTSNCLKTIFLLPS